MGLQSRIRGVLGNFVSTWTSRNSDHQGYWLFGFLVAAHSELDIDLLASSASATAVPVAEATASARERFSDQARKGGLDLSLLRSARVGFRRLPGDVRGSVNGIARSGYRVRFSAEAVTVGGSRIGIERDLFVAAHDPAFELRSTRVGPVSPEGHGARPPAAGHTRGEVEWRRSFPGYVAPVCFLATWLLWAAVGVVGPNLWGGSMDRTALEQLEVALWIAAGPWSPEAPANFMSPWWFGAPLLLAAISPLFRDCLPTRAISALALIVWPTWGMCLTFSAV